MIQSTHGFILHKTPYRETSFLIDLFTESLGRIKIIARSARSAKALKNFNLFYYTQWHLNSGRDFYFYKDCDLVKFHPIKGRAIWSAYYLNELLLRLIPFDQPDEALFNAYHKALYTLTHDDAIEPALRFFETALLQYLGVLPDFSIDEKNSELIGTNPYYVTIEQGILSDKGGLNAFVITGALLLKIGNNSPLTHEETQIHKGLMRYLIHPLLGDKPLQSRLWIEKLYRQQSDKGASNYAE